LRWRDAVLASYKKCSYHKLFCSNRLKHSLYFTNLYKKISDIK